MEKGLLLLIAIVVLLIGWLFGTIIAFTEARDATDSDLIGTAAAAAVTLAFLGGITGITKFLED